MANASLAIAMLATAGVADSAVRGVQDCPGVPGRMQLVSAGQGFLAVVDYAHTPDALQSVLSSLADQTRDGGRGRLIVVFGCGGDRDLGKRPAMGSVAVRLADVVIVTDDNPRSEEPSRIRQEILVGARSVPESERAAIHEVGDRGRAIAFAVDMARPGDVLVVAGKGHETGQEIAGSHEPFDDREVLLARLQDRSTEDGQRTTRGEKR